MFAEAECIAKATEKIARAEHEPRNRSSFIGLLKHGFHSRRGTKCKAASLILRARRGLLIAASGAPEWLLD
jgi:hypothetical protein